MKTKTRVQAGGINLNHNQSKKVLKVKTRVRAGAMDDWESPVS
jgi:hypothetical protein